MEKVQDVIATTILTDSTGAISLVQNMQISERNNDFKI